ncbi:hypothetical protein [Malikia sp.]|uniref:hypothetical protein n=1 Tax=Malikia sp. TaxID=2070706 RepID=UPI002605F789|nr:hypothetical protein [Malikia sp.]MDD2728383.1 hypothetical protein [Malikia sp.]
MQFSGYWISEQDGVVTALRDTLDETDLSESSNWTEAHQNEDPKNPAGYIHPARIVGETGVKLLQANPELEQKVAALQSGEFEIRTAEDLGLFCLSHGAMGGRPGAPCGQARQARGDRQLP